MIKIIKAEAFEYDSLLGSMSEKKDTEAAVRNIIEDVRENGDRALIRLTEKFDGAGLKELEVSQDEKEEAISKVSPDFLSILRDSAENIRKFHEKQVRTGFVISEGGRITGERVLPIETAGVYVPGGSAAYPSTVLMNAIPAKVAGCAEVVMVSPAGCDGKLPYETVAAAEIAGVDRIFKIGGAQAVAALAYGTETVPKADKITGPGNVFVAEAKRQVSGFTGIDMIAGPSEILIIADGEGKAEWIAADMLSQAEHDSNARSILITTSTKEAAEVAAEIERQLDKLLRKEIAAASIEKNGCIIIADSVDEAIDIANTIAPEHLELFFDDGFQYLGKIKNAGSVFVGKNSPEPLGDYFAGTNHTLPTMGTARFESPLSVDDFTKKTQFIYYSRDALDECSDKIIGFAKAEGLTGHGESIRKRKEKE